jgi:hypothetical protein
MRFSSFFPSKYFRFSQIGSPANVKVVKLHKKFPGSAFGDLSYTFQSVSGLKHIQPPAVRQSIPVFLTKFFQGYFENLLVNWHGGQRFKTSFQKERKQYYAFFPSFGDDNCEIPKFRPLKQSRIFVRPLNDYIFS